MANSASDRRVHSPRASGAGPCRSVALAQVGRGLGRVLPTLRRVSFPWRFTPGLTSGFLFVGLSFTCTVGSVMEIITCTDKAWHRMKEKAIKAPALVLSRTQRRNISVCG